MSKPYTLPISTHDADHFFRHSVNVVGAKVTIKAIRNPFLLLFVLFQEYVRFESLEFTGNVTEINKTRIMNVIYDLDCMLPDESEANVKIIQSQLISLFEANQWRKINTKKINAVLPELRGHSKIWSDRGIADALHWAFEYTLEMPNACLDTLRHDIANIAHKDPQKAYQDALRIRRGTDFEIDSDIIFREHSNGTNDPACLLLKHVGANMYEAVYKLGSKHSKLISKVFTRRFDIGATDLSTTTADLARELNNDRNAVNARKSEIDSAVEKCLGHKLFTLDSKNNLTFPNTYSCMGMNLRKEHQRQHNF